MIKQSLSLTFIVLFVLTGCTQTMLANSSTTESEQQVIATSTSVPTTELRPTSIVTPSPTIVPPTLTAVSTITATPQPTDTAIPTTTLTATATLTPTITPTSTATSACRPAAATLPHVAIAPGPWLRPPASTTVVNHGPYDADKRFIHLSFDVEGDGRILGSLLYVLDKHNVKTTLFVVGSWAEANTHWLAEAAARGHEFANHSYSHADMRQLSPEQIQVELQQTEDIIMALTGKTTKPWFRPPYGAYTGEVVQTAYEVGWTTVMWSGSGLDTHPGADEISICNALVQYAEPGAVLLLHTSNPAVVTAADRFITEMNSRDYTIVPLSVMLGG